MSMQYKEYRTKVEVPTRMSAFFRRLFESVVLASIIFFFMIAVKPLTVIIFVSDNHSLQTFSSQRTRNFKSLPQNAPFLL